MRKLVQSGGWKYWELDLPRLYHGIVKRKCLNKAREKTGAFFVGLSPDVSAALAVANFTKNVVSIDYPLTIAGVSKSSGGAQLLRREHVGNLEASSLFRDGGGTYKWADIIPRLHITHTIWAESTIAALKVLGRDDLLRDFNLPLLAAYCVALHPKYRRIILRDMYKSFRLMNKNQLVGTFQFCYSLLLGRPGRELLIKLIPKRIKRILLVLLRRNVTGFNDVKDIAEATNIMTDYLRKNKKRFSDFVS
ncbi:MAG: hypothetical protein DDT32_01633 [Syntrophomonadaceae bacterium]|nr:hypothetical protein [Bacillota bacterium]